MPIINGSVIVITYDSTDISNSVIYKSATFESQMAAQPGQFEFTVRDPDKVLSFVTGKEVGLTIDGVVLFGGYVTQVTRKFALEVDDTSREVRSRQWVLRGVDYNVLFDKRVIRDTANYLDQLPTVATGTYDGTVVKALAADYIDVPAGFDTTTYVEDVAVINPDAPWAYMQQGSYWRAQHVDIAQHSGAVWYFDGEKKLRWRALENSESRWGFSDVPNNRAITTSPLTFQGATIGPREIDAVEDGSFIVNDAFVWGGNQFSGDEGGTVFSRYQATDSIAEHGRWQTPEQHFGDSNYASQRLVDDRALVIVNGSPTELQPGSVTGDSRRGLRFSQWQIKLAWFAHNVPQISGVPQHLRPGDLTTHILYVLGEDAAHPLIQQLPLRQVRISFPEIKEDQTSYVRFDGTWSLQLSDPYTLWAYLLNRRSVIVTGVVSTANDSSTSTVYGAFGQFTPTPAPDGTTQTFDLPNDIGYLTNTTQVYLNGILQSLGTHYTETDPELGEITFYSPPTASDDILIVCRTT